MTRAVALRPIMAWVAHTLLPMITAQIAELREYLGAGAERAQANQMMLAAGDLLRRRLR